jgi:nicotinamidase/pyrazinamidase
VVDVQNDFAHPDGSLYVDGGGGIVPIVNREIRRAGAAGAFVCYTQDWHPEHTPHFAADGGIWPVHHVAGTWGSELHRDLIVNGPSTRKGINGEDGSSGFTMRDPDSGTTVSTPFGELLRDRHADLVFITGLALAYCVKKTTLDGLAAGSRCIVLLEGTRPVNLEPHDGDTAIGALEAAGALVR